jgi:uncharacterized membrane protein YphA (DoxX/SURF4 family)
MEYTLPAVQKLFSMFPRGAPGIALLLLRLFLGAVLITEALKAASAPNMVLICVLAAGALAIVVGFATPIASVLAALVETAALNTHIDSIALQPLAPVVIALALALLGPGAYSLDAKMFGRRLMQFGPDVDSDQ